MAKITTYFGIVLILLGITAYTATGMISITALIPSFFGVVFVIFGVLGGKEKLYIYMMYGAAALALAGLAGSARGLLEVFTLISGGSVERPGAVITQAIMAIMLIGYLIQVIKSFIAAQNTKEAQ